MNTSNTGTHMTWYTSISDATGLTNTASNSSHGRSDCGQQLILAPWIQISGNHRSFSVDTLVVFFTVTTVDRCGDGQSEMVHQCLHEHTSDRAPIARSPLSGLCLRICVWAHQTWGWEEHQGGRVNAKRTDTFTYSGMEYIGIHFRIGDLLAIDLMGEESLTVTELNFQTKKTLLFMSGSESDSDRHDLEVCEAGFLSLGNCLRDSDSVRSLIVH